MLAEGIGDILTRLPDMIKAPVVLAKPKVNLSTQQVFKEVVLKNINLHPDTSGIIKALREKNIDGICKRMYNVLEKPAEIVLERNGMLESVRALKTVMLNNNAAGALMSGSGPSVYGVFYDEADAEKAYKAAKKLSENVFLTTT